MDGWWGDCVEFNQKHPNCKVFSASTVGDGFCHGFTNTAECVWDGGDCVVVDGHPDCHTLGGDTHDRPPKPKKEEEHCWR